jgi:hypothetical protein
MILAKDVVDADNADDLPTITQGLRRPSLSAGGIVEVLGIHRVWFILPQVLSSTTVLALLFFPHPQ